MMKLFAQGIKENENLVTDQIKKSFDIEYDIHSSAWASDGHGAGKYGRVSVVQNIYSEAKTAADLMEEAVYQQEKAVILGV